MSSDRSVAATRLHRAGTLLFGDRYHSALAKELNVSRPSLHGMLNGKRRVPAHVEEALALAIRGRIVPGLRERTDALLGVADLIERTYGFVPLDSHAAATRAGDAR